MSLNSVKQFVDAELAGQTSFATWRKQPTQSTAAGYWFDLSMSPGNPVPNYYAAAPNIAVPLAQSTDGGIYHGGSVAQLGYTKYLKTFAAMTPTAAATPLPMVLCDYLLFYPFLDMSVTDYQPLTTNVTLPRYPLGTGVQIIAVVVAGHLGVSNTPLFRVQYTNQAGVTGRLTKTVGCTNQIVNGTLINTGPNMSFVNGPFLPLQEGDTGVRRIEGVQFFSADIGLIALVLVKPLANHIIRGIDAPAERNCLTDFSSMPVIADDAYLNLLCCTNASVLSAALHGYIQTIWG